MKSRIALLVCLLPIAIGVVACSSDDGPSQGEIQAQQAAERAAEAAESAEAQIEELEQELAAEQESNTKPSGSDQAGNAASSEPPNVVGLTLPAAKRQLKQAGFQSDPRNTDTSFGILIPENFTVCKQDPPRGNIVPLLAQKYGC